jgi:hypothetical protein
MIQKTQTLCWLLYASPVISGTMACNMDEHARGTSGRPSGRGNGVLVNWICFENRIETLL